MAYIKRNQSLHWDDKSFTFGEEKIEVNAQRVMDKYRVHNNEVHERRTVHKFQLSDVEDPELYAAKPILDWQNSDHGQWIMKHSLDPTFHIRTDYAAFGYSVVITAHISPKRWTEYCLKFDKFVY